MTDRQAIRPIILDNTAFTRTEFEFWATQHFSNMKYTYDDVRGRYTDAHTNSMWIGYAGRASGENTQ